MAVTGHGLVIMIENREPSAFYYCPPYSFKCLVNVYKFCVHMFTKLHDRRIPIKNTLSHI